MGRLSYVPLNIFASVHRVRDKYLGSRWGRFQGGDGSPIQSNRAHNSFKPSELLHIFKINNIWPPKRIIYIIGLIGISLTIGCVTENIRPGSGPRSQTLEAVAPISGTNHKVNKGDTLYSLASKHGVSVQKLAELNNLVDPYVIKVGQALFIPDSGHVMSMDPPAGGDVAKMVENYSGMLAWPVQGEIVSNFGVRDRIHHKGIRISAPEGATVRAAGAGIVGHVGTIEEFGKVVIIEHSNRIVTVYAHLGKTLAQPGQAVECGDPIGLVGDSGRVSEVSLYFEVRSKSEPRNPLFFLSSSGKSELSQRATK